MFGFLFFKDQQKYDLLLEMACNEIEYLFLSLIIPFVRPKVAPVVLCILSSIRHTPVVFHKVIFLKNSRSFLIYY